MPSKAAQEELKKKGVSWEYSQMALTEAGVFVWTWIGGASPPNPPTGGTAARPPRPPSARRSCRGGVLSLRFAGVLKQTPVPTLAQVWTYFSAIRVFSHFAPKGGASRSTLWCGFQRCFAPLKPTRLGGCKLSIAICRFKGGRRGGDSV